MNNATALPRIRLKKGRDASLRRMHPWVYSGGLEDVPSPLSEGDPVELYSHEGEFRGVGLYSGGSIAVKVLSFRKAPIGAEFWRSRLQSAFGLREVAGITSLPETDSYRLVHAEGDQLPGLIIDRYGPCAVMQCHHLGMFRERESIAASLRSVVPGLETIYCKSGDTLHLPDGAAGPAVDERDHHLYGSAEECVALEYGLKFKIDFVHGQKTGFFLDQRENRRLVGEFSAGKKVLNTFCYTGGFSVAALRGGAALVHSVDASAPALEMLSGNIRLNNLTQPSESFEGDAFDFLKGSTEVYDLIILDPPPFAKSRDAAERAISGYRALNHLAIKRLSPGGLLFTFSCSQVVDRAALRGAVQQAAADLGKPAVILRELGQAACHPASLHHPEGEYLKGFLLRVS